MRKLFTNTLIASVLCTFNAVASESKIVTIEGSIRSFDKTSVRITTAKGVIEAPRELIPSQVQLRANENIKIPLTEKQLSMIK